ncbi:MAG: NADH-quinone oxidoreductase subunit C [Deltaproteobacteria bacterium CG11_big_fil_rev_8_21_14_0_20_49_13]|nr:MAG: NADH-quinone oxidoreductase subunit C [Deltaproteobacteria bacterium CG11_big_fil_rev_8_21_14_0_20_49_13]
MFKEKLSYVEEVKAAAGDSFFFVPTDKIAEVCERAKTDGFDCLSCLTGADRGEHIEVVYHLFSYPRTETVVIKVKAAGAVASVSAIYPSAIWMEREVFDLLGVNFTGHPDLRRIMMPDDWAGNPLKKDYKEPAEYCGMTTTRNFPPL